MRFSEEGKGSVDLVAIGLLAALIAVLATPLVSSLWQNDVPPKAAIEAPAE